MSDVFPASGTSATIILASASASRAAMLANAGVAVACEPAHVDEEMVKRSFRAEGRDAGETAMALAELKAHRISTRHPGALVIGADQILICEDYWFDKPADKAAARASLQRLRNRTHSLVAAVTVMQNGERQWGEIDRAKLAMRDFSDAFLDRYLDRIGDDALRSVGAYQLEGQGAHLFHRVEGDFFTILGLPLLPLLKYLRERGVLLD